MMYGVLLLETSRCELDQSLPGVCVTVGVYLVSGAGLIHS